MMRADETDHVNSLVPAEPAVTYDPFSYTAQEDPYPLYAWMREYAPVYHNPERNFWPLPRYADVASALRDPVRFTNRNGISLEPALWGPQAYKNVFFLALDPDRKSTRLNSSHAN